MLLSALSVALSVSSAIAYPRIYQRQATTVPPALTSLASAPPSDTPSSALPSGPLPIAPGEPIPGPIPVQPSASASGVEEYPAYPCPADEFLTYVEEQRTYPFSVTVLSESGLTNWSGAPQFGPDVMGTGNDLGSTRMRTTMMLEGDLTETLVNFTSTGDFYQDVSNLTESITIGDITYSTWSQVFQIYANSTGPTTTGDPAATVKIFTNACASDMMTAEVQIRGRFDSVLNNVEAILQGQEPRVPGNLNPSQPGGRFTPISPSDMPSESGMVSEMPMPSTSAPSFMEPPSPVTPQTLSPSAV